MMYIISAENSDNTLSIKGESGVQNRLSIWRDFFLMKYFHFFIGKLFTC